MQQSALGHPRPLRPHVPAGRVTLPHPGAPGSLPKAAGAGRALGSCTSCRQRKNSVTMAAEQSQAAG